MPGFDGTGPAGRGPMTGRGCGYCILKKTGTGDRSLIGFAGLSGRPVSNGLAAPSFDRQGIRMRLDILQQRIRLFKQSVLTENRGGK